MDDKRTTWKFFAILALIIVNLIGWGRLNFSLAKQGYLSDEFVVNWVAARALITEGESPYQPGVTRAILNALNTDKAPALGPVPQFTAPIYTLLVFLPIAFIADLNTAQAVWMSLQQIVLAGLILLTVAISPTKPGRLVFGVIVLTTFFGYHALAPIYSGSTILMTSLFLLLALFSIRSGRDELGGVFLGLTTIQLPYIVLPVLLILLWSLVHGKRLVLLWFLAVLVLMVVLGVFVVSDWPIQYLRILFRYALYYPAATPGAAFRSWWPGIGALLSWSVTIITTLALLFEWWVAIRGDFHYLLWAVAFTLTISVWIGLPAMPQHLALLILPLILYVSAWSERWRRTGNAIAILCLLIIFVWEWWLIYVNADSLRQVDMLVLLIPLPVISLFGLYWVRSTIVHPKRLLIDQIRSSENFSRF